MLGYQRISRGRKRKVTGVRRTPNAVARVAGLSAAVIVLALAAGCGSTAEPNTSENTAPTLTWSVLNNNTHQRTDYPATATITWTQGDSYFIVFKANDPGGVKSISLSGGEDWQCVSGDLGQDKEGDFAPESLTFHPSSNGQVNTYEFLTTEENPGGWDCDDGFSFGGGAASFEGQASNFANRSAQGTLTIARYS